MMGSWFKSELTRLIFLKTKAAWWLLLDIGKEWFSCFLEIWYFGSKGLFYIRMILFLGFYGAYIEIWVWGQEWLSCPLDLNRVWSFSRLVMITF